MAWKQVQRQQQQAQAQQTQQAQAQTSAQPGARYSKRNRGATSGHCIVHRYSRSGRIALGRHTRTACQDTRTGRWQGSNIGITIVHTAP